jgi:hypothetical protein
MTDRVVRRLTMLREDAAAEPVPNRKFFHVGQPEVLDDLGESIPMISWVDDNLSRYIVADGPSSTWGKAHPKTSLFVLPNRAVKVEDGLFLITGPGEDTALPHPNGKGQIHFIHLGAPNPLWNKGLVKIYVYKLEGLQMKTLAEKKL